MFKGRPTRRQVLGVFSVASVGLPLLAACSPSAPAPSAAPTSVPAPTSPPAAAPTATVVAAAKPTAAGAAAAASTPASAVAASAPGAAVVVGGVRLPTYVPFAGAQPDSPGSPDGTIDNGYKAYPATQTKSVTSTPGD